MPPVKEIKKWSEVNRENKERKKKWREERLSKKLKIQNPTEEVKIEKQKEVLKCSLLTTQKQLSTVSIAVPGSIMDNAQSPELRTYLAGQIARAACIFQVDEIVIFDDYGDIPDAKKSSIEDAYGLKTARQCCVQLGRILQYLECPQYLRKFFFPLHKDLQFAGVLNPLDSPHHLRQNDNFTYREGVVTNKPVKSGRGSLVNVGLFQDVAIDKLLTSGLRCTVQLSPQQEGHKKLKGTVVAPDTPRKETGVYWGYSIRLTNSLSQIFSQCPYKKGYDMIVGTSDKGTSIDEFTCPQFKHLLIVFGGVRGLEAALEDDNVLNVDDPKLLFHHYLNTLPNQGSRTVRTEEAILVSLAAIRPKLQPKYPPKLFNEVVNHLNLSADNRFD